MVPFSHPFMAFIQLGGSYGERWSLLGPLTPLMHCVTLNRGYSPLCWPYSSSCKVLRRFVKVTNKKLFAKKKGAFCVVFIAVFGKFLSSVVTLVNLEEEKKKKKII